MSWLLSKNNLLLKSKTKDNKETQFSYLKHRSSHPQTHNNTLHAHKNLNQLLMLIQRCKLTIFAEDSKQSHSEQYTIASTWCLSFLDNCQNIFQRLLGKTRQKTNLQLVQLNISTRYYTICR